VIGPDKVVFRAAPGGSITPGAIMSGGESSSNPVQPLVRVSDRRMTSIKREGAGTHPSHLEVPTQTVEARGIRLRVPAPRRADGHSSPAHSALQSRNGHWDPGWPRSPTRPVDIRFRSLRSQVSGAKALA
jgi:hypothetical protein